MQLTVKPMLVPNKERRSTSRHGAAGRFYFTAATNISSLLLLVVVVAIYNPIEMCNLKLLEIYFDFNKR